MAPLRSMGVTALVQRDGWYENQISCWNREAAADLNMSENARACILRNSYYDLIDRCLNCR